MKIETNDPKILEFALKNHKATLDLALFSEKNVNALRNITSRAFTFSLLLYGSYLGVSAIHNKLVMPYAAKQLLKDKEIAKLMLKG